ncbi:MAG: WD40/YVTN/BNR-like repeat-containing protein, partial [Acidimicrobiales bacterium]
VLAAAVAAAVIAALAATGVLVSGSFGQPGPTGGTWRLAGYVDQPAWAPAASAGQPGSAPLVTCPSATTCYADQPGAAPAGSVVEVTVDSGASWRASPTPAGTRLVSGLSCPEGETCAVGAQDVRSAGPGGPAAAVLFTGDGGEVWSLRPVPPAMTTVADVACTSASDCAVLGYGTPTTAAPDGPPVALHTADAGTTWSVAPIPGPFVVQARDGASCAGTVCVAAGLASLGGPTSAETGAVRYSPDGGATWLPASIPPGVATVRAVSCTDPTHCLALANGTSGGGAFPFGPAEVLKSDDGGRNWASLGPPLPGAVTLGSISCRDAGHCWAAGIGSSSAQPGSGSGVIAATADGGATWSPVTLPTAPAPGSGLESLDVQAVSSVDCPAVGSCLALGLRAATGGPEPAVALRSPG